ncbi:MAG: hypothetical protein ATN35_13240 [Epulopiscium sp. Nele67-Bin004]|nr:MAG: hypothetical protein ATN35_13240 [Epulopiscium sp. Nele67-Bin004]
MESQEQHRIRLIISITYLVIGVLGLYSYMFLFLVPILTIPLIRHHLSVPLDIKSYVLDLSTVTIIFLIGSVSDALIFATQIILPSYVLIMAYKSNQLKYPQIWMLLTTVIWAGLVVTLFGMESLGVSYISVLIHVIDEVFLTLEMNITNLFGELTLDEFETITMILAIQKEIMRDCLWAFLFGFGAILALINIQVTKRFSNTVFSNKVSFMQVFEYRLSRFTLVLLLMGLLLFIYSTNVTLVVIGINIFLIMVYLYFITSIFALTSLILKRKAPPWYHMLILICFFVMVSSVPYLVLLYGIIDTIFNIRKVDIVV